MASGTAWPPCSPPPARSGVTTPRRPAGSATASRPSTAGPTSSSISCPSSRETSGTSWPRPKTSRHRPGASTASCPELLRQSERADHLVVEVGESLEVLLREGLEHEADHRGAFEQEVM